MSRLALITGASRGIGRAIAERLAQDGYRLVLLARQPEPLERLCEELVRRGIDAVPLVANLADRDALTELEQTVRELNVAVLVNNAGAGGPYQSLVELPIETWQDLAALNLDAALRLCRCVLPRMAACGSGRIINIASVYGLAGGSGSVAYTVAKHGLVGLTRALAVEWGPRGVTSNAICPGFIATEMLNNLAQANRERFDQLAAGIPARRLGRPEEVAELVAFMASDVAGYLNGAVIALDGGLSSRVPNSD